MKVVAFVPIKLNNERLPNKNILPLGGKPLCRHLLETLTTVRSIDEIYVFCSDPSIASYLPEGVKLLLRDKKLDLSQTRHFEIVKSFIKKIDADIYVNAHVTTPFITRDSIELGISKILSGDHDSALVVEELREYVWYKNEPLNFLKIELPRTQDIEPCYTEANIFICKKDVYINEKTRYGKNPYLISVDKIEAIDINYYADFELAQAVISARSDKL
jgi:CMP-N-acetylneuraminic acid synthetase